jgi:hypothetical protein
MDKDLKGSVCTHQHHRHHLQRLVLLDCFDFIRIGPSIFCLVYLFFSYLSVYAGKSFNKHAFIHFFQVVESIHLIFNYIS